jgi:predicted lipoprotein with Yx(FWY)xxD motif
MRSRTIAGLGLAGAALLAACGQAASGSTHSTAPAVKNASSSSAAVRVGRSPLGDVLVNADGRTLYGFTNDKNGASSCNGTCAQNWPPLEVSAGWKAGSPLDTATFHTVMRSDGHLQLAVSKWPLYIFSGDSAPGDVNGEGVLGKWFAVRPDGTLLKNSAITTPPTSEPAASGYGY